MEIVQRFSDKVVSALGCYVYRLIDPRNGATFYVGRGRGNRVFAHAADSPGITKNAEDTDLKLGTIRAIRNAGFEVQHVIHRHGLDERAAIEVESALIDAYPGLANLARGSGSDRGVMHANEIVQRYDAPPAVFRHDVVLIDVNRTADDRNLYDAVRYAWARVGRKAMQAKYALAVRRGLIIGVFQPESWMPAILANFPGMPETEPGRWAFVGREAPDEIKRLYVGKRAPKRKRGEQRPTRYRSAEAPLAVEE